PQFIGGLYVDLGDRTQPDATRLIRLPTPWIPSVVNQGHECLLAKAESFIDPANAGFDANIDRHVGQRNVTLALGEMDLSGLFATLSAALPADADTELLVATGDMERVISAYQPDLAAKLKPAATLVGDPGHLSQGRFLMGSLLRRRNLGSYFVPG